jgi:hypothetical protein
MKDVVPDLSLLLLKFAKYRQEDIASVSLQYLKTLVNQLVNNYKISKRKDVTEDKDPDSEREKENPEVKKDLKGSIVYGIPESNLHQSKVIY